MGSTSRQQRVALMTLSLSSCCCRPVRSASPTASTTAAAACQTRLQISHQWYCRDGKKQMYHLENKWLQVWLTTAHTRDQALISLEWHRAPESKLQVSQLKTHHHLEVQVQHKKTNASTTQEDHMKPDDHTSQHKKMPLQHKEFFPCERSIPKPGLA